MTYGRPGVYISERTLATEVSDFSTADAAGACIGAFKKGPTIVTKVNSWYDVVSQFGSYNASYPATFGVAQFFQNGGSELYVQRVVHSDAAAATAYIPNWNSGNSTRLMAKSKGTFGNSLRVSISPAKVVTSATPTAMTYASGVITITVASAPFTVGDNITISGVAAGTGGTNATNFNSTGVIASVNSTTVTVTATLTGTPATGTGSLATAVLTSFSNYWNVVVGLETVLSESPDNFDNNIILETFNNLVFNSTTSADWIGNVLPLKSKYLTVDETTGTYTHLNPAWNGNPIILGSLVSGSDGTMPTNTDYIAALGIDGTCGFDVYERPMVLFAPELYSALKLCPSDDSANFYKVQAQMGAWAAYGFGFAVLDTAPNLTVSSALSYTMSTGLTNSRSAMYYPNVYIQDPVAQSNNAIRKIGPSGSVAGLFINTDKIAGPFKAPAGVTAGLKNVIALEKTLTANELDSLNLGTGGYSVNAIRQIPGAGIVVMGARTLAKDTTTNKYVSSKRSIVYIRKQLSNLTQFALFENNNEVLWARLKTTVGVFLNSYRNQGGLRGASPDESFYVKIDSENNTTATIANGEVNIEIGVALERPAEFVVINISQMTAN